MKSIKQIITIVFLSLLSSQAYSQISVGGQASYLNLFGDIGLKNFGFGIKGEYAIKDKIVISGGVNYYLASKYSEITFANAIDGQTSPSQIEVDVEQKVSFIQLYFGGKRYFVGDYEADFGLYGLAEAGYLVVPITTSLGNFDNTLYSTFEEDGAKQTLTNFTLNFGFGLEKNLEFGYLFADLKLNLPANQVNGQTVAIEIPTSASINVGVRIPLQSNTKYKKNTKTKSKTNTKAKSKKYKRK